MVKKVVVTVGRFKDYIDEIQLTDYTRLQMIHLLPSFVFMMGRYRYWTMLSRWRLAIDILQLI